jgi:5'-nucleotidase
MKRLLALGAVAALLAGCATRPTEPVAVKVLAINDFHGNLLPSAGGIRIKDPADPAKTVTVKAGGAEHLATAVQQLRAKNPNHIFVAAGDLIGATPLLSALFKDEPTIESLSLMGLETSAVGNHEFDKGATELLRMQNGGCAADGCKGPAPFKGAQFKYLAASTVDTASGKTLFPAYHVKSFQGIPVAFIGLTLKDTPTIVVPDGVKGLEFRDEAATVNALVPQLRAQGIEAIVLLIHEGGVATGDYNECPGISGPIVDIVKKLDKAVDLVVSGHTHRAYNCRIDGRLVTSGDKYGSMLTDIRLTLERRSGDVRAAQARNVLVRHDQFGKDAEQTALLERYLERARAITERVVARLEAEIRVDVNDPAGASPMGQLIADAQLEATRPQGAEIAFMNSCGIRAGLPLGADRAIRYEHLFAAQPFGNQLITLSLSGAELQQLLQRQFRDRRRCNQLQVAHTLRYRWNGRFGAEARVSEVTVAGQPLQPQRDYRVTVNNFIAVGGDGFEEFQRGRAPLSGPSDVQALEAHVARLGVLQAVPLDRIRRVE